MRLCGQRLKHHLVLRMREQRVFCLKAEKILFSGETPLLAVNRGVGLVQPSYLCVIRDLARHGFSADFGCCGACAGGCFGCLVGGFFVVVLVCFLGR